MTREERLSTGSETNNNQLSFCKRYTVRRQLLTRGDLNGAIKRSLGPVYMEVGDPG